MTTKRALPIASVLTIAATVAFAQTRPGQPPPEQRANKTKVVALNTNELEAQPYDAGKVRFIATSEDTNSEYAVVELTEMPGYKTAWHRHNNCEGSLLRGGGGVDNQDCRQDV